MALTESDIEAAVHLIPDKAVETLRTEIRLTAVILALLVDPEAIEKVLVKLSQTVISAALVDLGRLMSQIQNEEQS